MTIKFLDSKRISTSPDSATSVQGYSQLNAGTNGWNIASGAGDGERLSLQIVSGSSIIADPIKEIKMKLYKNSSPTDTLYVRVRNSSDTILAEASKGASTLTGSLTEYTFTLNTGVILAQGDRINIEYTGSSGSGNIGCGVNNATEPSTVNCQKYDGTSYSDIDRTPDWQFDSSPSTTISILQSHPVNVQDNSILVEKDTAERYWAGSTVKIDTDFSSNTGWTNGGGGFVAISSGSLAYNCGNASPATSDSRSYYDLGTNVSESKWVLRFKMTSTVVSNSASSCHLGFGLSSITSAWDVNGSALVFVRGAGTNSNDNQYYLSRATLGGFVDNGNANKAGFSTSTGNVTNQVYYVELKRTSATTVVATIFSDEYVTAVESETFTDLSGVTGLRYLKCASRSQNTNTSNGTIDDVVFYNGVSSV